MRSVVPKKVKLPRKLFKITLTTLEFCLDIEGRRECVFQNSFSGNCGTAIPYMHTNLRVSKRVTSGHTPQHFTRSRMGSEDTYF